ncbi:family 78 glycoside hydrolase catalytic domain [Glaciecola sp. SC05]|uniref:family 78 glycoside hydrolase catalytic domain n=1 Tax=Glaciecola sp. SC05 TaxID=1987355 RepID=UPI00352939CF
MLQNNKGFQKLIRFGLLCVSLIALSACQQQVEPEQVNAPKPPTALSVGEGFENPLGYYESLPRFSWKMAEDSASMAQSAYQIQVASSVDLLNTTADLWDSQKTSSGETAWLRYAGEPLSSRQKAFWRVRLWDENDQPSVWSEVQTIELGLLSNKDWQAKWIGHPDTDLVKQPSQERLATAQYLRKTFIVEGEVQKARLYISAKGLFAPFINGEKVSEQDVMTPGWTPYAKRIESLTYDLTERLVQGENALAASIAGGWYAMRMAKFVEQDHLVPARLLAQLEITYRDGRVETLVTDDSWHATLDGPIRFASIYDGEKYDQNKEMAGWASTSFDQSEWVAAITETLGDNIAIKPKRHAPIRISEEMSVKEIVSNENGIVIFDFGQNMVGVPKLSIPVIDGQEVKVRFAEALHKGEFYTENYRSAKSTNYFLPNSSGHIEYTPTFTYHGYRYIEISGHDAAQAPSKDWATALVQHSDIDLHASFESSHPKLNQLTQNIIWGMRSNFYDIPLDCPQRDERLGWTGDAQVFVTPSMYMADVYGFWSAWLQSVREEQGEDGKIPVYIPFIEWINFASSGWGDAVTIIPWELYILTGDETILADNYDMMKGWLNFHEKKSKNHISNMNTFGDWLQPHPILLNEDDNGNRGNTNFSLIGTAYYARSVELTLNSARVLNKTADISSLSALHDKIKQAFLQQFFDQNLNLLDGIETQTTYLLGLAYDLFPQDKRHLALEKLIGLIDEADTHLRTGFLGTPLLSQVLQAEGRSDLVYELLFKESYPSWFYSINNGATTTWERWNSYSIEEGFNPQGMNSLNHYAYGTVSRWFYEGILGITPAEPGFKRINIAPQFGPQLTHAKGGYITPHGEVGVSWEMQGGYLMMTVTVPKNTTADIVLPSAEQASLTINGAKSSLQSLRELPPGEYAIEARILL